LTSYETGEAVAEPSKERHAAVAALLGLSHEQKQRIAQGSAVFKQLLTPVLMVSGCLQLLQQLGMCAAPMHYSCLWLLHYLPARATAVAAMA
jgi:hypothetical protein